MSLARKKSKTTAATDRVKEGRHSRSERTPKPLEKVAKGVGHSRKGVAALKKVFHPGSKIGEAHLGNAGTVSSVLGKATISLTTVESVRSLNLFKKSIQAARAGNSADAKNFAQQGAMKFTFNLATLAVQVGAGRVPGGPAIGMIALVGGIAGGAAAEKLEARRKEGIDTKWRELPQLSKDAVREKAHDSWHGIQRKGAAAGVALLRGQAFVKEQGGKVVDQAQETSRKVQHHIGRTVSVQRIAVAGQLMGVKQWMVTASKFGRQGSEKGLPAPTAAIE